ncbi:t-SNARE [Paraphysoderma sedebokerense]|nr:t-SNARE [Paraphysoderma sedebokerense]
MRDRLKELQKSVSVASAGNSSPPYQEMDLEKGRADEPNGDMKKFFDEVSSIRESTTTLKKLIQDIEETHGKQLTAVSEEQGANNANNLDNIMEQINEHSINVRNKLKAMEASTKAFGAKNPTSSDYRVRVSQHGVLVKKFTDVMHEYNDVQSKYKLKYKQRLQKQYLIVKPDATADEVEKVANGESGPIFAQQILPTAQYMEARKALQDIQDRHQDIVKIEKSILELQQLFMDMAALVSQQGDLINQIDTNVSNAVMNTEAGVKELAAAVKTQKRTRKRMCTLIFCFIIIGIVVILALTVFKR